MRKIWYRIKPKSGLSYVLHIALNAALPILVLILVRLNFASLAAGLILLAKWRTLAVKPRFWLSNIRSNLVDIFVGLSMVAFMAGTNLTYTQLVWVLFYIGWLTWLKPKSKPLAVMAQALIAQAVSLVAFYRAFPNSSLVVGIIVTWLICYAAARHFLGAYEEPLARVIIHIWAWFGAVMAWVLGHWVIEYLFLPQIALLLVILGYGLATIYYLNQINKLKTALLSQLIIVMALLVLIVLVLSNWQYNTF